MNKFLKYSAFAGEVLKGHLTRRDIPVLVTLCVTNRCNLKCIYCYEEYYDRDHREFTKDEIFALIGELSRMGTKYISVNGGEPLLREDIDAIIDRIKVKNMLCHLSTNGLLVKNHIPAVKKLDSLAISLDGEKEKNDLNRGKGVYDKVIDAIEYLSKNSIRFHTHTVLTRNNEGAVDEIMSLAVKYRFKAQFSPLRAEDSPDKKIGLDDVKIREIAKKILDYKKRGLPVFFSHKSYELLLNWPFSYNRQIISGEAPEGYKPVNCYLKRFSCHIEANGMVYPCIVLVNKFRALNFLEAGFRKAWENLKNNDCKGCYNVCCNDLNLMFGFNLDTLWNVCRLVKDRMTG